MLQTPLMLILFENTNRGARGELDLFSSVASTDAILKRKIIKHI